MNLAKALKEKNRLVGEINRIKGIIARENSHDVRNPSTVNVQDLYDLLNTTVDTLVSLKTCIFKANIGIYAEITKLGELKSFAEWLRGLPVREGLEETQGFGGTLYSKTFTATIKQSDVDKIIANIQNRINDLQDTIDTYNATTDVAWTPSTNTVYKPSNIG